MSVKEIRIPHSEISNSQTITDIQERKFKDAGLNMHRDELTHEEIIDDHAKGVRILKVRSRRTYFFLGGK